ncbi:MAG: phosphoenolpyruvate--protein phosphotransferase [Elusimicrobia bacterium]|nr:phosphoenolpyruvate--protein phosphotransferase [Elusimicrobiota bacterium]
MNLFHGVAASPGIGIGKIFLLEQEEMVIARWAIPKEEIKNEILRFRKALQKTKRDMKKDKQEMLNLLGKNHARLADAYLLILEDPILTTDIEKQIQKDQVNAEFVIQSALEKISHTFDTLTDDYFRERINDIAEVGNKILRYLLGKQKRELTQMTEESIVVAHNLLPSDTLALKTRLVKGFAIDVGGKTSHTALLAQSLEIPAVVGLKDISSRVKTGQKMIVDGDQGVILIEPDQSALKNYHREKEIQIHKNQELNKLRDLPAQTLDGKRIELSANIENAEDVKNVLFYGSEGIGLFRTEYLYLNRDDLPSEEEQVEHYSHVIKQMMPYSTLFRTLDLGGDKLTAFIQGYAAEKNPFMGLRALRFCLKYPDIFKTQLRALLKASAQGNMRIMFPMVSGVEEFLKGKELLERAREELVKENVSIARKVEVGAMIEVPSAALVADLITQEADFVSIGTNDLIQYTLAVDRVNENVASLYDPTHLSILRLVKLVADAAHAHGKWVGMCGEMASDIHLTTLLLGLGLDELSVVPSFIPRLKKIIRSIQFSEAKKMAGQIMAAKNLKEVQSHIEKIQLAVQ